MEQTPKGVRMSLTNIGDMQAEVAEWVTEKGWDKDDRSFGDELMLIVSEAAEALEAYRVRGFEEHTRIVPIDGKSIEDSGRVEKPDDVPSELADILVRLLDTCDRHGYDLGYEFRRKMDYNWAQT